VTEVLGRLGLSARTEADVTRELEPA